VFRSTAPIDSSWAMRLRPADATPLATRLAMELWPMPDGRELDAPQARLLEAVRWTPSSPREAERGDFTLERFWMHLTGLLSGISSVRRGNAGPDRRAAPGPWTWQEFLTRDDIAGALQVLLTSGHADPVVHALEARAEAVYHAGPRHGGWISAHRLRHMVEEAQPTMRAARTELISAIVNDNRLVI